MFSVVEQSGSDKAGTDICEADGKMLHASQLFQCIQVGILKALGCRIGRSGSQSFSAGNGTDYGNMSVSLTGKVTESSCNHSGKTGTVGFECVQFDVRRKSVVLMTDTGAVQVKIHTSQFSNEFVQLVCGFFPADINAADANVIRSQLLQLLELFFPPSGESELMAFFQ